MFYNKKIDDDFNLIDLEVLITYLKHYKFIKHNTQ